MNQIIRQVPAVVLAVLICTTYTWPQAGTGELTGIVTDPTGAVIVGATLDLSNSATGTVRTTITSSAGIYRFVGLSVVGTYSLGIQRPGFKTLKLEGIEISVGTTATGDIRLEVGAPSETISVVGGRAELVQTTESEVSTLIDRNIWQNMPLEVRSQNAFIDLVAGAVPDAQTGNTRGASVNGARGGAGNYMVEGVDNNDQGQAGRGQISTADPGGAATSISPDAISEYRVITNGYAAEYGKSGGFVTDTVIKSGTNKFHGSLFEYNRIQALAAQNFFANGAGEKDTLVRNQFGGSIGGPIVKDKAFIFYSMEWHRLRAQSPLHATGLTQEFLDFVDSGRFQQWAESDLNGVCMMFNGEACPGAFVNSGHLGPIFKKLRALGPFPLAQTPHNSYEGASLITGDAFGFLGAPLVYPVRPYGDIFIQNPSYANEYRISAKHDYAMTSKDQISFIYLLQNAISGNQYGGGDATLTPRWVQDARGQNVALSWIRGFSPTIANTFKMSYLRHRQDYPPIPGYEGIPSVVTAFDPLSVGFGESSGVPQFFTDNQFQYQDHISVIKGKHSFKSGVEYRRIRNGSTFYNDLNGTYYPYGIEELLTDMAFGDEADLVIFGKPFLGSMYYASASVDPTKGTIPDYYRGFRSNELAVYFQDDWRISPRFTLNWGLRYEYFGPPHNFRDNTDSNFYFGTTVTPVTTVSDNPYFPKNNPFYAGVATGSFQIRNSEIWKKDTNNFAPRLGFAWDIRGDQKLVLRAGAGIMYDRIYNNVFENIRFNPPYFSDNQIGYFSNRIPSGLLSTPGLYGSPFTSTERNMFLSPRYQPIPNPRHMDQDLVCPYYEQFHLGLQWEFYKGYVFEPEYIATIGRKLLGYYDINTFNGRLAGNFMTTRINTTIGPDNYRNNNFSSNYNAMQLRVRKNYAGGLGFNVNYTWSRALDNLSDLFIGRGATNGPTDTMNPMGDYGPSDYHLKHRFVGTFSYNLPFFRNNRHLGGWAINTIISLQSGSPFSPINSNNDLNADGRYTDRIVYTGTGGPMNSVTGAGSPADGYFNVGQWADYTCPASVNDGLWCNPPSTRNSMTGPGFKNIDLQIQKQFKLAEGVKLSIMGNFFNLFNHTNFDLPDANIASGSFGHSTAAYSPRITQLAFRIDF